MVFHLPNSNKIKLKLRIYLFWYQIIYHAHQTIVIQNMIIMYTIVLIFLATLIRWQIKPNNSEANSMLER